MRKTFVCLCYLQWSRSSAVCFMYSTSQSKCFHCTFSQFTSCKKHNFPLLCDYVSQGYTNRYGLPCQHTLIVFTVTCQIVRWRNKERGQTVHRETSRRRSRQDSAMLMRGDYSQHSPSVSWKQLWRYAGINDGGIPLKSLDLRQQKCDSNHNSAGYQSKSPSLAMDKGKRPASCNPHSQSKHGPCS